MRISLIKRTGIKVLTLPKTPSGSYWLEDRDLNISKRKLVNIEENDGKWYIKSNFDVKVLLNGEEITKSELSTDTFYTLNLLNENINYLIYVDELDLKFNKYLVKEGNKIVVGTNTTCNISYTCKYIQAEHAKLLLKNDAWYIEPLGAVFVNNKPITTGVRLLHGDVVFIMGLRIIVNNHFIYMNNPKNRVLANNGLTLTNEDKIVIENTNFEHKPLELFERKNYFYRAPRFRMPLEEENIVVDAPPAKKKADEMPIIYQIGPMLTMGLSSVVMGIASVSSVLSGQSSWGAAIPSIIIALAMLATMLLWPLLSKRYTKKNDAKKENIRQTKYSEYLQSKIKEINSVTLKQKRIIEENNLNVAKCREIIETRNKLLWERKIEHSDFLEVRLGIGSTSPKINLNLPEKHFELEEDNLKNQLMSLSKQIKEIDNVPITLRLTDNIVTAMVGDNNIIQNFVDTFLLKLMAFQSYEDVKLVVFTDKENEKKWEYLKNSPYVWNEQKDVRFFCTTPEETNQVSSYLKQILMDRRYPMNSFEKESGVDYHAYDTYYIVITDNFSQNRNVELIKEICDQNVNYGFSLIVKNKRLLGLPDKCSMFINVDPKGSGIFENELIANKQKAFVPDLDPTLNMSFYTSIFSNIPIALEKEKYYMPKMIGFLEMYNVGKIDQLNILKRWEMNNPINSLKAPVGINESGDIFNLDLHEKFHGPHGLIAGMTGSGKSEFIITYILSLAINYHPDEVAFALIDYKGGGLAGAFENRETGVMLPHLVGTITNLDTVEMNRSLASIQSELRRRQVLFNHARNISGESTIDIYKYQKLYREGKVEEPVPHLFIISDEFAELKTQQPDFMDQLISTARIGRSLGVHLILSTQKPSGVVDDQIWSNSRFRVCLKVQDKSDSMDMIKRPEAAALKDVGRFYLQVGYDELFALGQSAYSGAPYLNEEKLTKKVNNNIQFIDNIGNVIKETKIGEEDKNKKYYGEQLTNLVKYLYDLAKEQKIEQKKLWLNSIPSKIYVNNLSKKYSYKFKKYDINPIVGELDDPDNQKQHLLTMPLSTEGNTIIYGSQGSGKEQMLSTIIYSTVMTHSSEEVNFFVIDCGAETLLSFRKLPHFADVLLSSDEEKITNLLKLLGSEITRRKKLFVEYNGNYKTYIEKSGEKMPTLIVIINYFEVFSELYPDFADTIISLTREANKYGIIFIITTTSSSNLRYKLVQNFKQEFVLQLNDEDDYSLVLGNVHHKYPSKYKGRGLIKYDDIYEFQTAYMCDDNEQNEFIERLKNYLNKINTYKAEPVPILPDSIGVEDFEDYLSDLSEVPVGIYKHSLGLAKVDLKTHFSTIVSYSDTETIEKFVPLLYEELELLAAQPILVDSSSLFENEEIRTYVNSNFDKVVEVLYGAIEKNMNTVCMIVGIPEFLESLNEDNKKKFTDLFINSRKIKNINFVLIDTIDSIKPLNIETWFKKALASNQSIWLGDGVSDQFIIKVNRRAEQIDDEVISNYGYIIKNGNAEMIKILGARGEDDE